MAGQIAQWALYDVLEMDRNQPLPADHDTRYRKAMRLVHPDKVKLLPAAEQAVARERVILLGLAKEVLWDTDLKMKYDQSQGTVVPKKVREQEPEIVARSITLTDVLRGENLTMTMERLTLEPGEWVPKTELHSLSVPHAQFNRAPHGRARLTYLEAGSMHPELPNSPRPDVFLELTVERITDLADAVWELDAAGELALEMAIPSSCVHADGSAQVRVRTPYNWSMVTFTHKGPIGLTPVEDVQHGRGVPLYRDPATGAWVHGPLHLKVRLKPEVVHPRPVPKPPETAESEAQTDMAVMHEDAEAQTDTAVMHVGIQCGDSPWHEEQRVLAYIANQVRPGSVVPVPPQDGPSQARRMVEAPVRSQAVQVHAEELDREAFGRKGLQKGAGPGPSYGKGGKKGRR